MVFNGISQQNENKYMIICKMLMIENIYDVI